MRIVRPRVGELEKRKRRAGEQPGSDIAKTALSSLSVDASAVDVDCSHSQPVGSAELLDKLVDDDSLE